MRALVSSTRPKRNIVQTFKALAAKEASDPTEEEQEDEDEEVLDEFSDDDLYQGSDDDYSSIRRELRYYNIKWAPGAYMDRLDGGQTGSQVVAS